MRNRYYEPDTGRFMNRDLLPGNISEPLSMNPYAYVTNNPLQFEDPLGLSKSKRRYRINGHDVTEEDAIIFKAVMYSSVDRPEEKEKSFSQKTETFLQNNSPAWNFIEAIFGDTIITGEQRNRLDSLTLGMKLFDEGLLAAGVDGVKEGELPTPKVGEGIKLSNITKVNDSYLKLNNIDAYVLKKEILGKNAKIAEYDIYIDKDSGQLYVFKKGGIGEGIPTGEYINRK